MVVAAQQEASEQQELSATGRRKRKDTGTNRAQSRGWSEEEEKLFGEALDLHGRDWKAAAAHVGTRDARAFTSHAQKYFIKLAIAGKQHSTRCWTLDRKHHAILRVLLVASTPQLAASVTKRKTSAKKIAQGSMLNCPCMTLKGSHAATHCCCTPCRVALQASQCQQR